MSFRGQFCTPITLNRGQYSTPIESNNLVQSLEGSLKRLGTDYVELYWVHV